MLVLATVAAAVVVIVGPEPAVVAWTTQTLLHATFTWLAWRLSRRPQCPPRVRRFWQAASVGGLLFTAGTALLAYDARVDPHLVVSQHATPTVLVTVGSAWILTFILIYSPNLGGRHRLRVGLDSLIVMAAALVLVWTVSVTAGTGFTHPAQLAWTVVGAVIILVSAFTAVRLLFTGDAPLSVPAGVLLGLAITLFGVEQALNPQLSDAQHGRAVLITRLVPPLILAIAARVEQIGSRPRRVLRYDASTAHLPLIVVVTVQILLIGLLASEGLTRRSWGVVVGAVLIAFIVIVRQYVVLTDNKRLAQRLNVSFENLTRQEQRFRSLLQHASDLTLVTDAAWIVTYATPSLQNVLGSDPQAAIGLTVTDVLRPVDARPLEQLLERVVSARSGSASAELEAHRVDGSVRWLALVATARLDDPATQGIILNVRDTTEAVKLRERLRYDAGHDALTGLANRALFDEHVERFTTTPPRHGTGRAVLLIDLDDFKAVNDTYGHQVGDHLLKIVADRIRRCVRPTDTVARLGGDEFSVLMADTTHDAAATAAQRIMQALREPIEIENARLRPAGSIGIAVSGTEPFESLLRGADNAMYKAKREQSGTHVADGSP